jgi:hypothetical protein
MDNMQHENSPHRAETHLFVWCACDADRSSVYDADEGALTEAYEVACSKIVRKLTKYAQKQLKPGEGQKWKQGARTESDVFIIYLVDPTGHGARSGSAGADDDHNHGSDRSWKTLWLQRCFAKILDALPDADLQRRCVLHRLPLSEIVTASRAPRVASRPDSLRATAFAVFTKIRKEIPEPILQNGEGFSDELYKVRPGEPERLHVPLFVLAPRSFELRWFKTDDTTRKDDVKMVPFASSQHARLCRPPAARILHVAYTVSLNLRWAAVVWTDTDGVMLETAIFSIGSVDDPPDGPVAGDSPESAGDARQINELSVAGAHQLARELWERTTALVEATMLPWRVVVCALGTISSIEVECIVAVVGTTPSESQPAGGLDLSGMVLGCTIVTLDEVDGLQIFFTEPDTASESTDGDSTSGGATMALATCVEARSRALIQPTAFAPTCFTQGMAPALATVLINTNQPAVTLRSGRPRTVPATPPRSCTLALTVRCEHALVSRSWCCTRVRGSVRL